MAWPLGKPHEAAGYKKVRSTEHDIRSSSSSFSSSSSHYATGGAGNNKGSLGYGHAMGLERVREARAEQDVGLSILDNSVARLGELSLGISKEIDMQNRMLDDLHEETEKAANHADMITKQTQDLVKKAGGPKTFCFIVGLTCLLVILALLVVYT